MAITKFKMAGIGILIALLAGITGVVAIKEIQKRQAPGASEKPDIVAPPVKQQVHDQPESSKPETKDKPRSAMLKQPPKARNFQAEMEEALARLPKLGYSPELDKIMREWTDYDKDGAVEWTLRVMTGQRQAEVLGIVASAWAEKDPAAALEWAIKLPEGNVKDGAPWGVSSSWAVKDPDKAKKWIEKSSLSQDEKDKLLKKFRGNSIRRSLPTTQILNPNI